jgi:hypothetical protein
MPCACRAWLRVGVLDGPTVTHGSPIPTSSIFPSYIFNITGWWFQSTPLKNDGVKVSWDDEIANIWKVIKSMFQTTNQAKIIVGLVIKKFK